MNGFEELSNELGNFLYIQKVCTAKNNPAS